MGSSVQRAGAAVAASVVILLYAPSLAGGFLADDLFYLHALWRDGAGGGSLVVEAFTGPLLASVGSGESTFYRPLPFASLALGFHLWGTGDAVGYRVVNLLLHLAAAALVGSTAGAVLAPEPGRRSGAAALFAGTLFALHPLAAEPVAWISGRFDLLATLLSLASLRLFVAARGTLRRPLHALSLLCFGLALLSKESAAGLPLAVAAWASVAPEAAGSAEAAGGMGGRLRAAVARSWPFFALAAGYLALRWALLGTVVGGYGGAPLEWWQKEFWTVRLLAVLALAVPHPVLYAVPKKLTLCLFAYPAAVAGAVAVLRRRGSGPRRGALFAVAWLVAALLPHFPVLALTPSLGDARVLYLATAPFALLVAALLGRFDLRHRWRVAAALAVLAVAALLLAANLRPWVEAGRLTRTLRGEVAALARATPPSRRAVVVGVPDRLDGALVLRNGEALARPPFVPPELDGRVELRVGRPQAPTAGCGTAGVRRYRARLGLGPGTDPGVIEPFPCP